MPKEPLRVEVRHNQDTVYLVLRTSQFEFTGRLEHWKADELGDGLKRAAQYVHEALHGRINKENKEACTCRKTKPST